MRLADACSHRANADFGNELDVNPGIPIRVLQVVNKLGQIFDRVDIVMWRRRDQSNTRGRVTGLGNPWVNLVGRELSPLSWLGALRHFYLKIVGVHKVFASHAEPAGCHLFDRRPLRVAICKHQVAVRIFATFTRIGFSTQTVHGDRQSLVRLFRDRAVRHRSRRESLDDRFDRLHFVDWNGVL
ncbi:hypothetical protein GALL_437510 [mine drainage metagenome]|uniref:Uncharacterized protein n=1 Tax=mine drainage metagenome TaxID=410659 RepID=A0A1J5PUQ7_9ZZZZ